jgi:hypothetical protein
MPKRKQRKNAGKSDKPVKAARHETPVADEPAVANQSVQVDIASAPQPTADKPATRFDPAAMPVALPNATTLLDEVQQRCEKLRQWQRDAQASLQARAVEVERRERSADEIQQHVELGRTRLELDQDALKRARLMLDKERAQNEQSQQAIEAERARLECASAELNEQKRELAEMRSELDAEWASLARVRRAQESLAAALDADRTRIQELSMSDSLARLGMEKPNPEADNKSDDKPGLSLTQAA